MTSYPYLDKKTLRLLNDKSMKSDFNASVSTKAIAKLDRSLKYPVTLYFQHDYGTVSAVRCVVYTGPNNSSMLLDVEQSDFDALPRFEYSST